MFPLRLRLFCISIVLASVNMNHTAALRHERGVLFERDGAYDGIVPNDRSFYLKSLTGLDRIRCCADCQHDRPGCVGVLYNRKQMNCKLLKRYLTIADKDGSASTEEWEYLRMTRDIPPLECITDQDSAGESYYGTQTVVNTGELCQRWDNQTPHAHGYGYLVDQDNYCRNPDGKGAPWCFTVNPNISWRECSIHPC